MYFQVIYILNLLSNITNYIIDILYKINNLNNYIIFLNFPSDISSIEQSTKPRFWFRVAPQLFAIRRIWSVLLHKKKRKKDGKANFAKWHIHAHKTYILIIAII